MEAKTFTDRDSVAAYWREVSFNKLNLSGKVFDWVKIPLKKPSCSNVDDQVRILESANDLAKTVIAAARAEGYDYYVLAAPQFCLKIPDARVDGFFVPGTNFTFFNGNQSYKVFETIHELGHAFGLGHANALDCRIFQGYGENGRAIFSTVLPGADNALCQLVAYSDPLSVMGNFSPGNLLGYGEPPHISAFQKMALGWLNQSTVQTVAKSGIYEIQPAEIYSGQTVIRIPIDRGRLSSMFDSTGSLTTGQLYYYLDYRTPYGIFDTPSLGQRAGFGGVRLFIAKDFIRIPNTPTLANISSTQTYLVNVTPSSPSLFDAIIKPGSFFEDLERGIKIETLSADSGEARVKITLSSFLKTVVPGGGEVFTIDSNGILPGTHITWGSRGLDDNLKVRISLDKANQSGVVSHYAVRGTNNEIKVGDHDYTFWLSSSIPSGQYFFTVNVMDSDNISSARVIASAKSGLITIKNQKLQLPPPSPPPSVADLTPPIINLGGALSLGVPFSLNKETTVIFYANDPSGLAYVTIMVKSPSATAPLMKTCDLTTFHPQFGSCALTVSANQWVTGTTILVSAIDYSPNRNTALEGYKIVPSGQLQGN